MIVLMDSLELFMHTKKAKDNFFKFFLRKNIDISRYHINKYNGYNKSILKNKDKNKHP